VVLLVNVNEAVLLVVAVDEAAVVTVDEAVTVTVDEADAILSGK
jgi:hypothetical protein